MPRLYLSPAAAAPLPPAGAAAAELLVHMILYKTLGSLLTTLFLLILFVQVAAATSATMIMFTAGSACVVYSRFGGIPWDYGPLLLVLGFLLTLCGQMLTFTLVKVLGRRSVIVYMMGLLMAAASVVMYYQSGLVGAEIIQNPEEAWSGGHICG